MVRIHYPRNQKEAEIYGGYLDDELNFNKIISAQEFKTIKGLKNHINEFLKDNGYQSIDFVKVDETIIFENELISLTRTEIFDKVLLTLAKPVNSNFSELISRLVKFRDERDWRQFHNPKDLAIALNIETSELLEVYLWKKENEADINKVKEELADVFAYALLLANKYNLNVNQIILDKIDLNAKKYPINKAKGTAKKYNLL